MKITFPYTRYTTWITLLLLLFGAVNTHAQNYPSQEKYGQNRIQERKFDWKFLRTSNFEVYFHQGSRGISNMAAEMAEVEFDRITSILGYTPYNRVKLFLYNSPAELIQSNMGLASFGDLSDTEMDMAHSRIEIGYTGDQLSFRRKLIFEISQVFIYDMLYGGNIKDALQSSLLLNLPEWFMDGLSAYIAEGWSPEMNDFMREMAKSNKLRKPSLFEGEDAKKVGQSIWNYIAENHSRDHISNILNLTRIIRTEQTSITSTLGSPSYARFLKGWRDYYAGINQKATENFNDPTVDMNYSISKSNSVVNKPEIKVSADKKFLAVSELNKKRYKITVIETGTGKKRVIRQGNSVTYGDAKTAIAPKVAWSKNNGLMILALEDKGYNYYFFEEVDAKKPKLKVKRSLKGLDYIQDMDLSEDGGMMAVSADKKGKNDIYLINVPRASAIPLTNDAYDDLNPRFVGNSTRKVVFASNRTDDADSLKAKKGALTPINTTLRLYEHNGTPRDGKITLLVDSLGKKLTPVWASEEDVYFLSDAKGINNLFKLNRKSESVNQVTNYLTGIYAASMTREGAGGLAYTRLGGHSVEAVYLKSVDFNKSYASPLMARNQIVSQAPSAVQPADTVSKAEAVTGPSGKPGKLELNDNEVDTDHYEFDADIIKEFESLRRRGTFATTPAPTLRNRKRENISINGPYNYKGLFMVTDASSEWRIDPIRTSGFGLLQSVSMNDLLENHILKAGIFINTGFKDSDIFAEYSNNTYKVDFGVRVDRRSLYLQNNEMFSVERYRFNQISLSASYPFSRYARFTVKPVFAQGRIINLISPSAGNIQDVVENYGGVSGELVFDNSVVNGMNMREGNRFKIRYEAFMGIGDKDAGFNRLTIDLRRYQKVHRDVILAGRLAISHSGGKSPKQSIMGGMENWIGNRKERRTDDANPLDFSQHNLDIFFAHFANNLRGFNINRLSGTSYFLFNAELRVPLIKYIYRGPITSSFLRNFQIVGFSDIGTAWTGAGPLSEENSLNTTIIGRPGDLFTATVTDFRNPFLIGYGVGVRTTIFGIYGKFDYAWGLDNKVTGKAIPYLTLGYDF